MDAAPGLQAEIDMLDTLASGCVSLTENGKRFRLCCALSNQDGAHEGGEGFDDEADWATVSWLGEGGTALAAAAAGLYAHGDAAPRDEELRWGPLHPEDELPVLYDNDHDDDYYDDNALRTMPSSASPTFPDYASHAPPPAYAAHGMGDWAEVANFHVANATGHPDGSAMLAVEAVQEPPPAPLPDLPNTSFPHARVGDCLRLCALLSGRMAEVFNGVGEGLGKPLMQFLCALLKFFGDPTMARAIEVWITALPAFTADVNQLVTDCNSKEKKKGAPFIPMRLEGHRLYQRFAMAMPPHAPQGAFTPDQDPVEWLGAQAFFKRFALEEVVILRDYSKRPLLMILRALGLWLSRPGVHVADEVAHAVNAGWEREASLREKDRARQRRNRAA